MRNGGPLDGRRNHPRRVVIIAGASSGIGRSTARALSDQGWNVVLASRSATAIAAVELECKVFGIETLLMPTDVGGGAAVGALFETADRGPGNPRRARHADHAGQCQHPRL
jgi:NADP-dependent 3-hydroxy acid dehydrogenase YdfG